MKNFVLLILIFLTGGLCANAEALTGGVSTVGLGNKVVDAKTNAPIANAQVSLPKQGYKTTTDENGDFKLEAHFIGDTIMSVKKDGYRPFSLTINEQIAAQPMVVGIQKSSATDLVIDADMMHLGENN